MRRFSIAMMVSLFWAPIVSAQNTGPDVSIAVYEGGFSFIEESRSVRVRKGESRLVLDDLPDGVQPDTIVATFPKGGAVLKGQRFRQASTGLLQAFVGKTVSIASRNPVTGVEEVRDAKLLRARPDPLIELDGRIELTVPGRIALPNLPPDTLLRASLVLDLENPRTEKQSYRLSYMTTGPGWSADYALYLDPSERWARIQGRATMRTPDGRNFQNAKVRLVSGSVNRVSGRPMPRRKAMARARIMASEGLVGADAPASVSELHVYALPRRLDLVAGAEEKAILFEAGRVAVEKSYHLDSQANVHLRQDGGVQKQNPVVRLSFGNTQVNGLGVPLPTGVARLYAEGLLLGEDRLRHTPKGEPVRLTMGRAVDVIARRKRTEYRMQGLPKGTAEAAYEIRLSNAKREKITVEVRETMVGEWRILSESLPHERDTDRRAKWHIEVPAEGEATLQYRVRSKFR
jgi:hypothetical protein